MKIKRYKIKPDATRETILRCCHCGWFYGGSYVTKGADFTIFHHGAYRKTHFEFSIDVAFKPDVQDWNDFDNILVLDEDWCQPYTPFYDNYGKEVSDSPTLEYLIDEYNRFLGSLEFLEEVEEDNNGDH